MSGRQDLPEGMPMAELATPRPPAECSTELSHVPINQKLKIREVTAKTKLNNRDEDL